MSSYDAPEAPPPLSICAPPPSPISLLLPQPCLCPHISEALMLYLPLALLLPSLSVHATLVLAIPLAPSLSLCLVPASLSGAFLLEGL